MVALHTHPVYRGNPVFPETQLPGASLPVGNAGNETKERTHVLPITQAVINTALGVNSNEDDMLALVRPKNIGQRKAGHEFLREPEVSREKSAFERILDKADTWLHAYRYAQSETESYMLIPIRDTQENLGFARCIRTLRIDKGELDYSLRIVNLRATWPELRNNAVMMMSAGIVYYFLQEAGVLSHLMSVHALPVNTRVDFIESDEIPKIAREAGQRMFWKEFSDCLNRRVH